MDCYAPTCARHRWLRVGRVFIHAIQAMVIVLRLSVLLVGCYYNFFQVVITSGMRASLAMPVLVYPNAWAANADDHFDKVSV